MNLDYEITTYFSDITKTLAKIDIKEIEEAFVALWDTVLSEGTVYCIGNGGSASTASHFANDFNKGLKYYTDLCFKFNCLSDNIPTITAIANDIGYDDIYLYQLIDQIKEDDILLAISGSGNSKNIIKAAKYARDQKAKVIGVTGFDGGLLKDLSDISLHVPIKNMQITEDIHLIFNHLLMTLFIKWFTEISIEKS